MSRCYLPFIDAPVVPFLDAQGDFVRYRGLDDTDARFLSACLVDGSVVLSAGVPPSVASSLVAVPLEGYAFRVVVFTHPSAPEWVGEYIETAQETFRTWYHGQPVGVELPARG